MAAVTICSDFGAPKNKSDMLSTVSPSISHEVMGPDVTQGVSKALRMEYHLHSGPGGPNLQKRLKS